MKSSDVIEKFGGLTKLEPLTCLDNASLMENACLLESSAPFKGYYDDVPDGNRPLYLFMALEGAYTADRILRASMNVKENADLTFDAAFGSVDILEHSFPIIRIRDLENFSDIDRKSVV